MTQTGSCGQEMAEEETDVGLSPRQRSLCALGFFRLWLGAQSHHRVSSPPSSAFWIPWLRFSRQPPPGLGGCLGQVLQPETVFTLGFKKS